MLATTPHHQRIAVLKSRIKTFLFFRLSLPLLTNTLPGPSASEVTTSWRYTYLFIIIIIISRSAFCALTMLLGHQEEHPVCKN